jgi:hypothetical protein
MVVANTGNLKIWKLYNYSYTILFIYIYYTLGENMDSAAKMKHMICLLFDSDKDGFIGGYDFAYFFCWFDIHLNDVIVDNSNQFKYFMDLVYIIKEEFRVHTELGIKIPLTYIQFFDYINYIISGNNTRGYNIDYKYHEARAKAISMLDTVAQCQSNKLDNAQPNEICQAIGQDIYNIMDWVNTMCTTYNINFAEMDKLEARYSEIKEERYKQEKNVEYLKTTERYKKEREEREQEEAEKARQREAKENADIAFRKGAIEENWRRWENIYKGGKKSSKRKSSKRKAIKRKSSKRKSTKTKKYLL